MNIFLSKTDEYILKTIRILLFLCVALPIFASSFFLFPYTAPKAFLFRIIIEIVFVLYLYLILREGTWRSWKDFLNKNIISLAIIFFVAVWFLSSIFSADSSASFWGTFERMIGFWGILHFVVFYFLLLAVFQEKRDWIFLLKISVGASFIIAILGILQRFVDIGVLLPHTSRITSLIGNASFLATYLLINLFFVVYLFLKEIVAEKKKPRILKIVGYILISAIIFSAMFLTATRGALLGFFGGAVVFSAIFAFWGKDNKVRKYFMAALLVVVFLAIFSFIFRESSFFQNNSVLRRFSSMSLSDSSVENRLLLWKGAWTAWQERPVLGWGSEGFEMAINKHFDPRLNYDEAWYDRAHNFVFDYGVGSGWLGLLSYLSLFGVSVFCLIKIKKRDFFFFASFSSLLVAYLTQAFFVFDVFASYLMLFLTLGIIISYYSGFPACEKGVQKAQKAAFGKKMILALAIIIILFSLFSFNLKPLYANYLANAAIFLPAENYEQINLLFKKADNFNAFASNEIAYQLTLDYLDKMNSAPALAQNSEFFERASANLEKSIALSPLQTKNYIALAWLNLYFSGSDSGRIGEAIVLAQKVKELAPTKKDGYMILAAAYVMSGDNAKAQRVVSEAMAIDAGLGNIIKEYFDKF